MGNRSFVFELLNYRAPASNFHESCGGIHVTSQRGQAIRRTFVGLSFCLFLPCFLMKSAKPNGQPESAKPAHFILVVPQLVT
jgi:hypothetical protein